MKDSYKAKSQGVGEEWDISAIFILIWKQIALPHFALLFVLFFVLLF